MEKAYKLLAVQEGISNRAAKELIDRGVVYYGGKKVVVARGELDGRGKFRVEKIAKPKVIFEDDKIVAVDKPAFLTAEEVAKKIGYPLLHRLDKETSGVMLLYKDEDFQKKAVEEFKKKRVKKEYIAVVHGKIVEPFTIDEPLLTIKKKNVFFTKVHKDGKEAITHVEPMMVEGKKSKIKVIIETGRTHQIRAHLKSSGYPILGDSNYGGKNYKRVMLHAYRISLLGYAFESREPREFKECFNN